MPQILKHDLSIFIYAILSTLFFTFAFTEDHVFSLFSGSSVISSCILIVLFLAYKKQPPYGGRLFLYRTADLESVQFFYGETTKYAHSAANLPCHASCLRSECRIFQSAPLLW